MRMVEPQRRNTPARRPKPLRASEPLNNYDPRQYVRELTAGNVGLLRLLRVVARAVSGPVLRRLRLLGWQPLPRQAATLPTRGDLDLQPGDTVEVRSKEEITRTVDENGKTRGLWFDWEMIPYCGGRYRVRDRVERIIDERTGQMIEISSDCLILDGVVCSGECSTGHWLCPRAQLSVLAGSLAAPSRRRRSFHHSRLAGGCSDTLGSAVSAEKRSDACVDVTVGIPTRNRSHLLAKAIASVLGQSLSRFHPGGIRQRVRR